MNNRITIERRVEKRIYLKYACSFTIFSDEGLLPFDTVELIDISKDGLSFTALKEFALGGPGDTIRTRLYLNSFRAHNLKYYLPVLVHVANTTDFIDKEGNKVRYGCNIEKSDDPGLEIVLKNFIKFIESSTKYLKEDKGDYFISNTVA